MAIPEIKKELVVTTGPCASQIYVSVGTPQAYAWVIEAVKPFCDNPYKFTAGIDVPCKIYFFISECYDISEVIEYLEDYNRVVEEEQACRQARQV